MVQVPNSRLLVEGVDDYHVVKHLMKVHFPSTFLDIDNKEGFLNLRKSIYDEVNRSECSNLGILTDTNGDIGIRWKSITTELRRVVCEEIPPNPDPNGSIFRGPRGKKIGVWLMPDNQNAGELEDFIHAMIPTEDSILPLARCYIDRIPEAHRKFNDNKLTRAYVHAWLATREKPRPMGLAITARDLHTDSPASQLFIGWLRQLFPIESIDGSARNDAI